MADCETVDKSYPELFNSCFLSVKSFRFKGTSFLIKLTALLSESKQN